MFVYISAAKSKQILVLRMSTDGELTPVQEIPMPGKVAPLAISPDCRFLYAALRTKPVYSIASFSIDARSGALRHLANSPAAESLPYICTDRTGRFLFGASNPDNRKQRTGLVTVSAIGPHGFVQPCHQIIRTPPKTHAILPDPSNRYVLATSCDGDLFLRYEFDQYTGMLTNDNLAPVLVKPKAGPRHFVFHPNSRFVYLLNEYDASIYVYAYDCARGELNELQIASALPAEFDKNVDACAADLHFTPDGKFLYASVRTTHTLAAFKVDALSGTLTSLEHYPTVKTPRGFNIDPYGRYLLAAGLSSNDVATYAIDSETGGLTKLKEYPMGEGPNWIEFARLP